MKDPELLHPPGLDQDGVQSTSALTTSGQEIPDPVPMAPPVGYNPPPDLMTMIRTMIQSEQLRQELARQEFETFEEAEDFDIPDDPLDPHTEYEAVFDPPPLPPVPLKPAEPPATSPPEVLDTSGLGGPNLEPKKTENKPAEGPKKQD